MGAPRRFALESQVGNTARYTGKTERALCVASNQGHRRIYERIAAQDPDGAADAMFRHITEAWLVRRSTSMPGLIPRRTVPDAPSDGGPRGPLVVVGRCSSHRRRPSLEHSAAEHGPLTVSTAHHRRAASGTPSLGRVRRC